MDRYNVTGMSCAACQAHVEKAVSKVPGVESVSVSLLTNSMGVEGNADAEDIIKAVEDAGYGASPENSAGNTRSGTGLLEAQEKALEDTESPVLRRRLISSVVFLLVLMYFSMGHTMLHLPLPSFFEGNHVGIASS